MSATQFTTRQLGSNSVTRDDIDITTTTKALIAKIVAGTNITISSTGVDAGTGDVTINAASSSAPTLSTLTSNTTITAATTSKQTFLADATGGSFTITLPTAVGFNGLVISIKRINSGTNTVTIATTSSQTIDGDLTQILNAQWTSLDFTANGTNWGIF